MSARLFVGLALPAAARTALAEFRDAAADPDVWRPVPDTSFHVTLAFLGHRPEDDVDRVTAALATVPPHGAPPLRIGAALVLPPRRGRVLAATLEDVDGTLAALQSDVSAALAAGGLYEPETRPFRPHVTVARLRARARAPRAVEVAPAALAFRGGRLTLFRSRLSRDGAAYEPLFARRA
jgi:2'-5' RNA ligase